MVRFQRCSALNLDVANTCTLEHLMAAKFWRREDKKKNTKYTPSSNLRARILSVHSPLLADHRQLLDLFIAANLMTAVALHLLCDRRVAYLGARLARLVTISYHKIIKP